MRRSRTGVCGITPPQVVIRGQKGWCGGWRRTSIGSESSAALRPRLDVRLHEALDPLAVGPGKGEEAHAAPRREAVDLVALRRVFPAHFCFHEDRDFASRKLEAQPHSFPDGRDGEEVDIGALD